MLVPVELYGKQQVSFCSSVSAVWITALFQREIYQRRKVFPPSIILCCFLAVSVINHLILWTNKLYLEAVLSDVLELFGGRRTFEWSVG